MSTLTVILAVTGLAQLSAALGAALAALAAAWGIGRIGSHAMDAIARQPEAAGDIRSNMIVSAALIEGVSFAAVVVALLALVL